MKRKAAALVVWLAFSIVCVVVVWRADFSTDLQAFLPEAPTPAQQVLVDQLKDGAVSRMVLIAIEGDDASALANLSQEMVDRLAIDPDFAYVNNGSEDRMREDSAFLLSHRYLLSPSVSEGHFDTDKLKQSLRTQLELLSSSVGPLAANLISRDPTGEFLGMVEKFESRSGPQTRDGVWFDTAGMRALLVARTVAPGYDIDAQQNAIAKIRSAFSEAQSNAGSQTTAKLIVVGPGVFATEVRQAIKADAIRVTTAASVAIAGFLLMVLRSFRALILILVPVVSGALAGIAAVALGFGAVHGITIGFGATLIGESVDYAIHLLLGSSRAAQPEAGLHRVWATLRLGVMTSVVGSAALMFSGFPGLAQLGLFSIAGLIVALAVTRWVLPVLIPGRSNVMVIDAIGPQLIRLADRARHLRMPALLGVAFCAAWLVMKGGVPWNDSIESLNPISEQAKLLDREIRTELGAPDVRNLIVVSGIDAEATLQITESVGHVLDKLHDDDVIAGYESPTQFLPSQAAQRTRQDAIPDEARLRRSLDKAVVGLPFKSGIFEPFVLQTQEAKRSRLLTRKDLDATGFGAQVDALLVERRGTWYAFLPLLQVAQPAAVTAALAHFDPQQVMLVDLKAETDALYSGYRAQILAFSIIGAIAIVMLLLAVLRSIRRCFAVVWPIVAALIVTIALLVGVGVNLTMFHLVAMLLIVGVGSNYTLFFDRALQRELPSEQTYVALATCNLSTVLGFGLISLASTPVLAAIGSTVAVGAVLCLVFGAVFVAPTDAEKVELASA